MLPSISQIKVHIRRGLIRNHEIAAGNSNAPRPLCKMTRLQQLCANPRPTGIVELVCEIDFEN